MKKISTNFPFLYVYCVSLQESTSRRQWITGELKRNNIPDYTFVDAVNEGEQIVEDAYDNGVVKLFPPCFRCGKEVCNCENNVLIKTQVATFYSHMKVWKIIADNKEGMYLIIEDDIVFNRYYKYFNKVFHKKINRLIDSLTGGPLLMRFAWAFDGEHRLQQIRFINGLVKMSNPMYSINPEMARVLLNSFTVIDTTVDVYIHRHVASQYNNYTLMPPLAHELSYSHGEVESLVRPRQKRIEVLQKRDDGISKNELLRYNEHIDRAISKRLLAIGHPCTGAGFISVLLKEYGLDVEKEAMGSDGIVSWMFTVLDLNNPYYLNKYAKSRYFSTFEKIVMFVEDPLTAIPSIICENKTSEASYRFRAKHISKHFMVNLDDIENEFEQAIESYYLWSKLALLNNPELIVRVEEDEDVLKQYLQNNDFEIISDDRLVENFNKKQSCKNMLIEKPRLNNNDWLVLGDVWKNKLNELCLMFGYQPIYDEKLSDVIR